MQLCWASLFILVWCHSIQVIWELSYGLIYFFFSLNHSKISIVPSPLSECFCVGFELRKVRLPWWQECAIQNSSPQKPYCDNNNEYYDIRKNAEIHNTWVTSVTSFSDHPFSSLGVHWWLLKIQYVTITNAERHGNTFPYLEIDSNASCFVSESLLQQHHMVPGPRLCYHKQMVPSPLGRYYGG